MENNHGCVKTRWFWWMKVFFQAPNSMKIHEMSGKPRKERKKNCLSPISIIHADFRNIKPNSHDSWAISRGSLINPPGLVKRSPWKPNPVSPKHSKRIPGMPRRRSSQLVVASVLPPLHVEASNETPEPQTMSLGDSKDPLNFGNHHPNVLFFHLIHLSYSVVINLLIFYYLFISNNI